MNGGSGAGTGPRKEPGAGDGEDPEPAVYRRRRRIAAAVVGAVIFGAGLLLGLERGDGTAADGDRTVAAGTTASGSAPPGSTAAEASAPVEDGAGGEAPAADGEGRPAGDPPPWAARRDPAAGAAGPADGSAQSGVDARRRTALVEAAGRVKPSVVSVRVRRPARRPEGGLFEFFSPFRRDRMTAGIGSGFVIDSAGHVLTNYHVVRGADRIDVADAEGRVWQAELVGGDELTDVALLEIEPGRIPPAPLGTSEGLLVGEPALALGNPFGFQLADTEPTVTAGVVSGSGRDVRTEGRQGVLYADMIQTDASINPGNSGGPLVNALGRVVGVNASILSESGGSVGVAFAIPIDRALRIADELRRFGRVRQTWVGAEVASVPADTLLSRTVVRRVAAGSPAEEAGIRSGDVLLSLAGAPIDGPMDWEVALLDAGVGSRVPVRYLRDGRTRTGEMRVRELPSERAERVEVLRGLQLVSVTPQIAAERDLRVDRGALIVDITERVVRATRMREGDVILAVNGREVASAEDAARLFRALGEGRVQVWLARNGSSIVTTFGVR